MTWPGSWNPSRALGLGFGTIANFDEAIGDALFKDHNVFRERVALIPGTTIDIAVAPAQTHVFDFATGARL